MGIVSKHLFNENTEKYYIKILLYYTNREKKDGLLSVNYDVDSGV